MRGSQTNVYLLPADTKELEARLKRDLDYRVVSGLAADGTPRELRSLEVEDMGNTALRVYLLPAVFAGRKDLYSVEARQGEHINPTIAPLVEFDRCYYDGEILRRGRFYGVESATTLIRADIRDQLEYRAWLRKLMGSVRASLTRQPGGVYAGIHAVRAMAEGLRLANV